LLVLIPDDPTAAVLFSGRSYRGRLSYAATDSATLVINVVPVEQYLRGVVPLEIGARPESDMAAVQAQAVVARSFAFERMNSNPRRRYDLTALEIDQVYGGIGGESAQGDAAVNATRDLVLSYNGHAVGAPYHAVCGGNTASASDVWKTADVPYLRSVDDRVPGTDRAYCDLAPRSRWERSFTAAALRDAAERYLRQYASLPERPVRAVREVQIDARTPLGRVTALSIVTEQGAYRLAGNDIRYVLRGVGGDLLPSTYFSLEPVVGRDGTLTQLALRGHGNGHGVGLCQWGAIGRARAGQDVRTILRAYFPATALARGA
jgi:stage II sporulation protein D